MTPAERLAAAPTTNPKGDTMARSPLVMLEYPTYSDINTTRDTLKMLRKAILRDHKADLLSESAFFALIAAERVLARLDQVPGLHLPLETQ